jgi:hypothetical protein
VKREPSFNLTLRDHRQHCPVSYAHYRRPGEARLHGACAPAKADPLVRRLPVPRLGDRDEVGIAVVVEVDDTAERVDDAADATERVIVNRDVVAVAVLDLTQRYSPLISEKLSFVPSVEWTSSVGPLSSGRR